MTVAIEKKVWTDLEFTVLPSDGGHYELVNGELVNIGNSGMEHGNLGSFLGGLIELYSQTLTIDPLSSLPSDPSLEGACQRYVKPLLKSRPSVAPDRLLATGLSLLSRR